MKCFHYFSSKDSNGGGGGRSPLTPVPNSVSGRSNSSSVSMSTDLDLRRSGSEFNSQNMSDFSTESSAKNSFAVLSQRQQSTSGNSHLRVFTFSELKTATKNFSRSLMIGEGGFGGVYRGVIKSTVEVGKKIDIAVKQLSRRGLQGHKEWVTEVNLLVYEYMPNRSVLDHLSSRFQTSLSWATRMKIAQDTAKGLAYLHEGMDFQIIFRDFKSSNILLDEEWNAKLSDFGLARLGPSEGLSHVSTAVVGTIGYAAPEYIQTGRLTSKSDVWSYGVFLYELITGRRPLDRNKPKNEQKLLEWVRQHLSDMRKFRLILDPKLEGKYDLKSAQRLAAVANRCLLRQAKARPKMSEVVEMLNKIMDSAELGTSPQLPMKMLRDPESSSIRNSINRRFAKTKLGDKGFSYCRRIWRPKCFRAS
ncbi:Serine/threonine-protein kinase PCRK1 [Linum grandiflorum]